MCLEWGNGGGPLFLTVFLYYNLYYNHAKAPRGAAQILRLLQTYSASHRQYGNMLHCYCL